MINLLYGFNELNLYMEWSFEQDKMLSTLETLLKPERTKRYICCIFKKKKY